MTKLLIAATLVGLILIGQGTAYAIPILQLYIEGATYDTSTETWVVPAGIFRGGAVSVVGHRYRGWTRRGGPDF